MTMDRRRLLGAALVGPSWLAGCATTPAAARRLSDDAAWRKLDTVPYRGKQDDVAFADARHGWYVNGEGKIYCTEDAGARGALQLSRPGTYFRCVGFVDSQRGFAGNIGTDAYPGVTDETPLYRTDDGGATWQAVKAIAGPAIKGLCAIDVLRGTTGVAIHAAGRVGGPAFVLRSLDAGATWRSTDLGAQAGMVLDVKFFDEANGLLFCGSDAATERSNALILRTSDGGSTWVQAYRSARPYELTWKASFASRDVGYATVQNYNPDTAVAQRHVLKTSNGGRTWTELPLVADYAVREFGIGFVNEREGWVGTTTGGFETRDGGASWQRIEFGRAVNKIRIVPGADGAFAAYAIGIDLWKYAPRVAGA
jgi:photosystem II stability/assembly factor-like uncharacterized protein